MATTRTLIDLKYSEDGTLKRVHLQRSSVQLGVDAFAFNLLLLVEHFHCLGARFEELRAQTLDELQGVVEQFSPVVERPRYNAAASEKQILFGVVGTSFKRRRQVFLVTSQTKQVFAIFNAPTNTCMNPP
jgi:hypothetical protein